VPNLPLTRRAAGMLPAAALGVSPDETSGTYPGPVSARELGAKGDFETDDTEALDSVAKRALTQGRDILLEPGTYRITRPWVIGGRIFREEALDAGPNVNPLDREVHLPLQTLRRPSIFGEGATLVGDFEAGPILYYGLEGSLAAPVLGTSTLSGLTVFGRGALSRPNPESLPTDPGRQIGILTTNGLCRIERVFVRDAGVGLLAKWAFWQVADQLTFLRCGTCVDAREANAQTLRSITCWYSHAGLRISGDAYRVEGLHTENVRRDLEMTDSWNAVVGPCYLEDAVSGAGSEDFFIRFGGVRHCVFQGVRAHGFPPKRGWVFDDFGASLLLGCRHNEEAVLVAPGGAKSGLIAGSDFGDLYELGNLAIMADSRRR
jgi:hypothetical protein